MTNNLHSQLFVPRPPLPPPLAPLLLPFPQKQNKHYGTWAMEAATKTTLSNLVEEHLTSLVREAACVQRHAKRARFYRSSDGGGGSIRWKLHSDDINLALQWRGSEKLYLTNAGGLPVVAPDGSSGNGGGGGGVSNRRPVDRSAQRVDLNAYVRSEMRTRPPSEIGMTVHWLAVDGVQPDVPQNPSPADGVGRGGAVGGRVVHRVELEEEDYLYDGEGGEGADGAGGPDGGAAAAGSSGVSVRRLLPRLLSEELQLYFTRVTLAVERGDPARQDAALASVARDAGTQELVPFFARFVSRQIYDNIGKAEVCRTLVRLANSLVSNPHLHLELHLHQMLPALITCVVARRLSSGPFDDHWALREEAAATLVKACNIFGDQYTTLKARVIKTLCEAMGPDRPLPTQYGGIVGISLFGPKTIDAFLLQLTTAYWTAWETQLETETEADKGFEIRQCQHALLNALSIFLSNVDLADQAKRLDVESFVDVFGEKLVPLQVTIESDYVMCVL